MDEVKIFSTTHAARILGISRQLLRYYTKKGKIKPIAFIQSKYLFFTEREIEKALTWKRKSNAIVESVTDNTDNNAATGM